LLGAQTADADCGLQKQPKSFTAVLAVLDLAEIQPFCFSFLSVLF